MTEDHDPIHAEKLDRRDEYRRMTGGGFVSVKDGMAVLHIPPDRIHALLVALADCPCKAPKSNATMRSRHGLAAALIWARNRL